MTHSPGLPNNPFTKPNDSNLFISTSISLLFILILSAHILIVHPRGPFPISLSVKILKTPSYSFYKSCSSQFSGYSHPNCIGWTIYIIKFLTVKPSVSPILIPLQTKYFPSNLSSNTLSLSSFLHARDHVPQPWNKTRNRIFF